MTKLGKMHGSLLAGLSAQDRQLVVQRLATAQREQTETRASTGPVPMDGDSRPQDGPPTLPRTVQRLQAAAEAQQQIAVELSKAAQRRPDDRLARRRAMRAWRECERRWQALGKLQRTQAAGALPR